MHFGGNGMTCFIRPQSLSNFIRRSFLPICSSWVFSMSSMSDQRALGLCIFSSVDSLCISMISSFKTHSRGRPGFLVCFIELRLSDLRFKDCFEIQVENVSLIARHIFQTLHENDRSIIDYGPLSQDYRCCLMRK